MLAPESSAAPAVLLACASILGCVLDSEGAGGDPELAASTAATATSSTEATDSGASDDATATTTAVTTADTSAAVCASACASPAPPRWTGPYFAAVTDPDAPASCPNGYDEIAVGHAGLEAAEPTCQCECEAVGGGCQLDYDFFSNPSCSLSLGPSGLLNPGACSPQLASGLLSGYLRPSVVTAPSECTPSAVVDVPPPVWDTVTTVCAPPQLPGDCGDELCVPVTPQGFQSPMCIFSDGDVPCPDGEYSQRSLAYRELLDERSCGACECQTTPGACSGQMIVNDDNACQDSSPTPFAADGSCQSVSVNGAFSISFQASGGETSCAASTSPASGEVSRIDPFTICCASD